MIVYLINIGSLLIYGILLKPAKNNKIFCFLASLHWIFLSGMRHVSIGADTEKYKYLFEAVENISWNTLCKDFVNILFKGIYGKDPGYPLFVKIVQIATTNYQVYLIMIAILFSVPLGIWIYKNSSEPLMSFLIYSCLFYSFFAITGIRQTIATAIVTLVGYKFVKEKKLVIFLFLILIAMTIHYSAIYFLPFYFIANKKITNRYLLLIMGTSVFIFMFKERLFNIFSTITRYEHYKQYDNAGTYIFTTFLTLVFIVTALKNIQIINIKENNVHYINALLISMLLVPFTFINASLMRIIQYYSLFLILLIPEIIKTFHDKEKAFVYTICTFLLILLLIKNNPVYLFFWQ